MFYQYSVIYGILAAVPWF